MGSEMWLVFFKVIHLDEALLLDVDDRLLAETPKILSISLSILSTRSSLV